MLKMIILVCAMQVAHTNCRENTALDVLQGPDVASPAMCAFEGQAFLAQTTLTPRGPGEYVKIICRPSTGGTVAEERVDR